MRKTINFCGNCPFMYIDDYLGENKCSLINHLNIESNYIIDNIGEDYVPDWCPILIEDFNFSFKKFSQSRLNNIELVKNKITEIENFFNDNDYDLSMDNKNVELSNLYIELAELQTNEEFILDDFNDKLDDIREQLNLLNETFSNLGK